jgi:tetratricopeptide (TPR) repeat protein
MIGIAERLRVSTGTWERRRLAGFGRQECRPYNFFDWIAKHRERRHPWGLWCRLEACAQTGRCMASPLRKSLAAAGRCMASPLRYFLCVFLITQHAANAGNIQPLVSEVQRLSSIGDHEAVVQMKFLHPELSQSARAMECFAFADQDLRNMKNAMAEFAGAERLAPTDVQIQTSLVYGLYGVGSHREALYRISRIIAKAPKDARARAIQALILQQMGTAKEAQTAMNEAEKLGMSIPVWEAKYNFAIGNLDQAGTIRVADAYLKAFPNDLQVRMFHGKAMRNAGKLAIAASDFQKVLKANPNHMSALTALADAYRIDGKIKQSVEYSERRLKLARTFQERRSTNRVIAETYEKVNNYAAAAEAREHMIAGYVKRKECRDEWQMKDILACCRDLVALKRWKEAEERLNLVLMRYPESSEALEKRAQCYTNLNRLDEAIKDYSRLIEIHNDVAPWYRQRASLFKRVGRAKDAEKDLKQAKSLEASSPEDNP